MIDVSKIRVGDEVTVKALVAESDDNEGYPIRLHGGSWIKRENIVAHHPTPREFKLGDRVTWNQYPDELYEFIAERDGQICLWRYVSGGFTCPKAEDLRHADESE